MPTCIIINGHTDKDSFAEANAEALQEAAKNQGFETKLLHVNDFPRVGCNPAKGGCPIEFNVLAKEIAAADYIALTAPMWNLGVPGVTKNFIDGVMQARVAFAYHRPKWWQKLIGIPNLEGLLQAKKVVFVWTCGGPAWTYTILGNPMVKQLKLMFKVYGAKQFVSMSLGSIRKDSDEQRVRTDAFIAKLRKYKF